MLGVTVLTGVLGWVCLIVAGHRLGPAGYARFAVVWGVLFGLGGAFSGLQQEVTRATHRARPGRGPVVRDAAPVALVVCLVAAFGVAVVEPAGLGGTAAQVALVALVLLGFASMTFVNGVLSQRREWGWVATVLCLDAVVRTVALLVVLADGNADNTVLVVAIGLGPLAWWVLLGLPTMRSAMVAPGADPAPTFTWRASTAIVAAAATTALVAGFPMLFALVYDGSLDATTGSLLAGLVLVRSPLLVVVFGLRPVLLRGLLASAHPVRDVFRIWGACLGVAVLGGAAALLLGRPVLALVMGQDFHLPGWQLAVLLVGCVWLAMMTVSGLALIAMDAHVWSTVGWLTALTATVALLAVPGTAGQQIMLALALAPIAGLAVHAVALGRGVDPARAT